MPSRIPDPHPPILDHINHPRPGMLCIGAYHARSIVAIQATGHGDYPSISHVTFFIRPRGRKPKTVTISQWKTWAKSAHIAQHSTKLALLQPN